MIDLNEDNLAPGQYNKLFLIVVTPSNILIFYTIGEFPSSLTIELVSIRAISTPNSKYLGFITAPKF